MKSLMMCFLMLLFSLPVWAQAKYSIKKMTPEVQQALDSRRERYNELQQLKKSGDIGENNQGYVEAMSDKAKSVANAENNDRKTIYRTIAEQNGLEGALDTIEEVFAKVQREKAEAGDKIQNEKGEWVTK